MSEAERSDRLDPSQQPTVDDIRALAGPATPHFALQIRNRIERLIAPPARRTTRPGSRAIPQVGG